MLYVSEETRTNDGLPIDRSEELKAEALELIPGVTQTNSKGPGRWVQGVSPAFLERAAGSRVWDVDGNEYVDYLMACGPVVLGHCYPPVTEAVEEQLGDGTTFSKPHPLEVRVARRIVDMVPCAEMVRFGKNGNDVTAAAARLARAYTGRDVVATHGYHGWQDVYAAASGSPGVPEALEELTEPFEWNDLGSVERIFERHPDDVAAIVTTPMVWDEPSDGFLTGLREIADREDALLVFDEVLTGFRFAPGGAQEYFDVTPDLACFAKAIANGYPLSALAGRRDVMSLLDGEVNFSLTYGGETLSLAAAAATLDVLANDPVHDHIFDVGRELKRGYNDVAAAHGLADRTSCRGLAPFTKVEFREEDGEHDPAALSLFMQECHRDGVLFADSHLPTYSHTDDDVEETLRVYDAAMGTVATAIEDDAVTERLDGRPVGSPVGQ